MVEEEEGYLEEAWSPSGASSWAMRSELEVSDCDDAGRGKERRDGENWRESRDDEDEDDERTKRDLRHHQHHREGGAVVVAMIVVAWIQRRRRD